MTDAASLHCPNCGAPVDPELRRCPYCEARLATVSCPSCFALMFDGSAFCPGCGARRLAHGRRRRGCPLPGLQTGIAAAAGRLRRRCSSARSATASGLTGRRSSSCAPIARHRRRCCISIAGRPEPSSAGEVPALRPLREDDEPRQLRAHFRRRRRRLQGPRHVPRSRRAARDRPVHSQRRPASARATRQLEELREQEKRALDAERRAARERGKTNALEGQHSWSFLVDHDLNGDR